ncbi:MAG: NAD-dependent epimerase/dehydratase family protein [Owenweeksia sp.]|nr:NAD-dependent epimerase/dehydratase family protein [Owenweeksia sp.]
MSFAANDATAVVRTNVEITTNVLNTGLACGVQKLLHVSSVAALGRTGGASVQRKNTNGPKARKTVAYARGKCLLSELEAWRAFEEGLRPGDCKPLYNTTGPGNWQEGSAGLVWQNCRRL